MKKIFLVVGRYRSIPALESKIHGAFNDRALADACRAAVQKKMEPGKGFSRDVEVLEIDLVEWGTPLANELMMS